MIIESPSTIGVWTEEGRKDIAAGVAVIRDGDSLRVTIEDTGIGISSEDLPNVFNRF